MIIESCRAGELRVFIGDKSRCFACLGSPSCPPCWEANGVVFCKEHVEQLKRHVPHARLIMPIEETAAKIAAMMNGNAKPEPTE